MCDYSLQHVKSRPAKVGDKLKTHHFNTGTIGFAAPEDVNTAVCVLPGTELAFARAVSCQPRGLFGWKAETINHTTACYESWLCGRSRHRTDVRRAARSLPTLPRTPCYATDGQRTQ